MLSGARKSGTKDPEKRYTLGSGTQGGYGQHGGLSYGQAVQDELRGPAQALGQAIPEVYDGYRKLHAAAYAAGALDRRTKELIALAIAVGKECDGCIATHARGAARTGATEAEVAEALGVAIAMNGGPGTVYGPRAFAAFQEFAQKAPLQRA